jgi:hypothetical protein
MNDPPPFTPFKTRLKHLVANFPRRPHERPVRSVVRVDVCVGRTDVHKPFGNRRCGLTRRYIGAPLERAVCSVEGNEGPRWRGWGGRRWGADVAVVAATVGVFPVARRHKRQATRMVACEWQHGWGEDDEEGTLKE